LVKLYRDFESQEEIDAQYNIGASLPGWEKYLERYISDSASTRQALECQLDIQYGPTLDESVDVFPSPQANSPILVFIHGGYWRALSSKEFSFIADTFVKQGITVVVSNYSLCPKVSIAEITRQNRALLAWLSSNTHQYNGDPDKIFVSGHSAGGQLTAMMCSTNWSEEYGLAQDLIKGGIAISGLFDLQPFRYSYLQPTLMLSHELIMQQSPCFVIPETGPEMIMTVGEKESSEFHRQAQDYQLDWNNKGMKAEYRSEANQDHFSILYDLTDEDSTLFARAMKMMQKSR
jgi:arylformamidase